MKLIKIGRTEGNDLVIKDDTTISRNHAEIFQDDEGNIFLTDLSIKTIKNRQTQY